MKSLNQKNALPLNELEESLRGKQCSKCRRCEYAILETSGQVTVIQNQIKELQFQKILILCQNTKEFLII